MAGQATWRVPQGRSLRWPSYRPCRPPPLLVVVLERVRAGHGALAALVVLIGEPRVPVCGVYHKQRVVAEVDRELSAMAADLRLPRATCDRH